jgi:hypothetical protein
MNCLCGLVVIIILLFESLAGLIIYIFWHNPPTWIIVTFPVIWGSTLIIGVCIEGHLKTRNEKSKKLRMNIGQGGGETELLPK